MVHSHENKRDAFFFSNKTIKENCGGGVTSDKENVSGKKVFFKK